MAGSMLWWSDWRNGRKRLSQGNKYMAAVFLSDNKKKFEWGVFRRTLLPGSGKQILHGVETSFKAAKNRAAAALRHVVG